MAAPTLKKKQRRCPEDVTEDDSQKTPENDVLQFDEMGLDDRLLKAIAQAGWQCPTLIQEKAIPLWLEGKDVLARARTGSGKTGAFIVPLIQKILTQKQVSDQQEVSALVMAPSRELCKQIYNCFQALSSCCNRMIRCVDISPAVDLNSQKPLLVEKPDVVVGTPSRLLMHLQAGNLNVQESLHSLIIDEADLVFSFGHEQDVRKLMTYLPSIYQACLMSATLTEDVITLKKIVLHNPVILKLEEPQLPCQQQLTQYIINCEEEDKFVLSSALFKLNLVRGKTLVFVNSVDRCYKLKLFLEQFGVKSCALNSELPLSSRCHIVNQFNDGMYNIIIASEEKLMDNPDYKNSKSKKRKQGQDKEYGICRGIDFQLVSNVINFDFPSSINSYIHRVGRTARGNNLGTALSFVAVKDQLMLKAVEAALTNDSDSQTSIFRPFQFKMEEVEGFKYRSRDAFRAVTSIAVREARLKEIKQEIMTSKKLQAYFQDNPQDLSTLRHDKALHTVKLQSHLHDVPDYIVPPTLLRLQQQEQNKIRKRQPRKMVTSKESSRKKFLSKAEKKFEKKQADPLKSFQFSGMSKERNK